MEKYEYENTRRFYSFIMGIKRKYKYFNLYESFDPGDLTIDYLDFKWENTTFIKEIKDNENEIFEKYYFYEDQFIKGIIKVETLRLIYVNIYTGVDVVSIHLLELKPPID